MEHRSDPDTVKLQEWLRYARESAILSEDRIAEIQEEMIRKEREKYLSQHTHKIWQGADGKWYTFLPDATKPNNRRKVKKATQEAIEEAVIEFWRNGGEFISVRNMLDMWNDRRLELGHISPATYSRIRQDADRYIPEFGKKDITRVTEAELTEYLEESIGKFDLTAQAYTNMKTLVRGIFKRANRLGYSDVNAEDAIRKAEIPDRAFKKTIREAEEEVFNDEEFSAIMSYLVQNIDVRNLAIIVMFLTGIRPGEACTLKHSDVEGNAIRIRRTETRYKGTDGIYHIEVKNFPKTAAGVRTVLIPNEYSWVLEKLRLTNPFSEFIFLEDGERLSTQKIRRKLYKLCNDLGIYRKSPNKLRKTWFSIMLDNKIDNNLITTVGGHTNISITEDHYHRNRKTMERMTDIISSVPEFRMDFRPGEDTPEAAVH